MAELIKMAAASIKFLPKKVSNARSYTLRLLQTFNTFALISKFKGNHLTSLSLKTSISSFVINNNRRLPPYLDRSIVWLAGWLSESFAKLQQNLMAPVQINLLKVSKV